MSIIRVDEEGIKNLLQMSNDFDEAVRNIENSVNRLRCYIEDKEFMLGPHYGSLMELLNEISHKNKDSYESISYISDQYKRIAELLEELLRSDPFGDK